MTTTYLGRYAPSPTGDLHLGNALAAVCAWARARRAGGRCLLRMEDLDRPRVVAGAAARIATDLAALGLSFDADPSLAASHDDGAPRDDGAPAPGAEQAREERALDDLEARGVLVQSRHPDRYQAALLQLREAGLLYACRCSRKDLLRAASAPHEGEEGPPYPGTCRDLRLPFDDPQLPVAWRFRVPPGVVVVDDVLQGRVEQDVAAAVGDFVVRRKDGLVAYQLAVVVDDALQEITEVVRGRDLLSSAPRQVQLFHALGRTPPAFAHVPLWLDAAGNRVSKRNGTSPHSLRTLFARGLDGAALLALIGVRLGACPAGTTRIGAEALAARLEDRVLAAPSIIDPAP